MRRGVRTLPFHTLPTTDGGGPLSHHFLDTGILTKNIDALYSGSLQTYASALATRITVRLLWVSPLPTDMS
jgi:hypothetical protein